ncbi:MAG: YbaB/EbfC family nucleoid-associated protein [Clostridia bacterium]|nr:YbaB/EbfC family nucleoid-associated protein [Clostridia bacterium]MBO7150447.1 YbaB/EbfC family nucleoid-associated protein [Clostridia bacterium]
MKVRLPNNGANMQNLLKQAQKMQEDMATLKADLETREYDVSAGGGAVTVRINGTRKILNIEIDPDIVDPDDVETLQDILVAAVNEAIKKVDDTEASETAKLTDSMGMGGMGMGMGMPGMF